MNGFTSYWNFTTLASTNLAKDEYENYNSDGSMVYRIALAAPIVIEVVHSRFILFVSHQTATTAIIPNR